MPKVNNGNGRIGALRVTLLIIGGMAALSGMVFGAAKYTADQVNVRVGPVERTVDSKLEPIQKQVAFNCDKLEEHTQTFSILVPAVAIAARNRDAIAAQDVEIDALTAQTAVIAGKLDMMLELQRRIMDRLEK